MAPTNWRKYLKKYLPSFIATDKGHLGRICKRPMAKTILPCPRISPLPINMPKMPTTNTQIPVTSPIPDDFFPLQENKANHIYLAITDLHKNKNLLYLYLTEKKSNHIIPWKPMYSSHLPLRCKRNTCWTVLKQKWH